MNKLRKHFFWVNLLIFQSAWSIAIFLRDSGILPLLVLLCAHFWLIRSRTQDLLRIATVLPLGVMLGGGLALFNLVEFEGAWAMPVIAVGGFFQGSTIGWFGGASRITYAVIFA